MKLTRILSVFFITLLALEAFGSNVFLYNSNKKTKGYDLSLTQFTIKDIKISDGVSSLIPTTLSAELLFRVYHNFQIAILAQSSSGDPKAPNLKNTEYGLGFKANIPGIFFLGARKRQLIVKNKNKPYNTAIYTNLLNYKMTNSSDNTSDEGYETVFGFEFDVFLMSPMYLKINLQLHNRGGNFFSGTGIGLGYEF